MDMAGRRNGELHSGELPFAAMRPEAWVSKFWQVCKVILEVQNKTLEDWLGATEAVRAEEVINNAMTAMQQAILARIERHRIDFEERYPAGSHQRTLLEREWRGPNLPASKLFGRSAGDIVEIYNCPACSFLGLLSGEFWHEEILGDLDPEEPWVEYVQITYATSAFRCQLCNLKLDGREELDVAGVDEGIQVEQQREVEFEPDYGDD